MIASWVGQVARYWQQHVHKVSEHLLLETATRVCNSKPIGESACAAAFGSISDTTDALRVGAAQFGCAKVQNTHVLGSIEAGTVCHVQQGVVFVII